MKKNESSGELEFLRYSVKGRSAGRISSSDNAVKHIFAEKNTYRAFVNMFGDRVFVVSHPHPNNIIINITLYYCFAQRKLSVFFINDVKYRYLQPGKPGAIFTSQH